MAGKVAAAMCVKRQRSAPVVKVLATEVQVARVLPRRQRSGPARQTGDLVSLRLPRTGQGAPQGFAPGFWVGRKLTAAEAQHNSAMSTANARPMVTNPALCFEPMCHVLPHVITGISTLLHCVLASTVLESLLNDSAPVSDDVATESSGA